MVKGETMKLYVDNDRIGAVPEKGFDGVNRGSIPFTNYSTNWSHIIEYVTFDYYRTTRFGNFLFKLAAAFGVAKRFNAKLIISSSSMPIEIFNFRKNDSDNILIVDESVYMTTIASYKKIPLTKYDCKFDPSLFGKLANLRQKVVVLHRDEPYITYKYFGDYQTELLEKFRFNPTIRERIEQRRLEMLRMQNRSTENTVTIGVHIRAEAEFRGKPRKERSYSIATVEYFSKAMNYFRYRLSIFNL